MSNIQLMQGDCLELLPTLADGSVDMVLCDLPYGTTDCSWDAVIPFEKLWPLYWSACKPNAPIVLTASQPFNIALAASQLKFYKYEWIWRKSTATGHANAKKQPLRKHENVCVFYKSPPTYNPQMTEGKPYTIKRTKEVEIYSKGGAKLNPVTVNDGSRYPVSVLDIANEYAGRKHPTQKPVALMEYLIRTYTNPGETVLDNTMGSGTTGVACVNTGRNFIGMEMDEGYFNIARQRIGEAQTATQTPANDNRDIFGAVA